MNIFSQSMFILTVLLVSLQAMAEDKPVAYKWMRSSNDDLACYAYSTQDNKLLYQGQTMDEAYCKKVPKPLVYKWMRSPQDDLSCFAISTLDEKPLYQGQTMDVSYCSKLPRPIAYKWMRSKEDDLSCYAYTTLDNQLLYQGMSVDVSFCENQAAVEESLKAASGNNKKTNADGNVNDSSRSAVSKENVKTSKETSGPASSGALGQ